MLKKMTTGFTEAVRVIAEENINAVRSFGRDAAALLSRLAQMQSDAKLREDKKPT
jgi:hypothetical protein